MMPPGPPLPPILQTAAWLARPNFVMEECHRRYGDAFLLNVLGIGKIVFISDPDAIRRIFHAPHDGLAPGDDRILRFFVGESSVLLLNGPKHIAQRRVLLPPFHGSRMGKYADEMRDTTDDVLDTVALNKPISLHETMKQVTMRSILRSVFGLSEYGRFPKVLHALGKFLTSFMVLLPAVHKNLGPLTPYGRFLKFKEEADQLMWEEIRRRRAEPEENGREDVLSLLLRARHEDGSRMSDVELRDELITLLTTGHDTTAIELAWVFERILSLPHVRAKMERELQEVIGDGPIDSSHVPKLEYLDAIVKETLRTRPIVAIVARRLTEDLEVGKYRIPAGTGVAPCLYLTHQRPDIFPNPEEFRPERFIDKKYPPYEFMPFGGGDRRCIGREFAQYQIKVVVATVFGRARLRMANGPAKMVRYGILMGPEKGGRAILEERLPRRVRPAAPAAASA